MMHADDVLLSTTQVAQLVGLTRQTVNTYIEKGLLATVPTEGGHNRIKLADALALQRLLQEGPTPDTRARVIVFTNQKGGVGKTTLTVNLAVLLHGLGARVLVVDLDPQGHATFSLGINPDQCDYTIYNAFFDEDRVDLAQLIQPTAFGPDLAPINIIASGADRDLMQLPTWGTCLQKVLERITPQYDYVLIDTAPHLGSLLANALIATDFVVIPTQLEMLSARGISLLWDRIEEARKINKHLQVAGVVPMMVQAVQADLDMRAVVAEAFAGQQIRLFQSSISRSTEFKNVANARSIMTHKRPQSPHTKQYRSLLRELLVAVGDRSRAERLPATAGELADLVTV